MINNTSVDDKLRLTILDRPNTNRAVALLILLQASTSIVQKVSGWFAERVAKYLEVRTLAHQRSDSIATEAQFSEVQFRDNLEKFFGNESCDFLEEGTAMARRSKRRHNTTNIICTICRLERTDPAVPSSCGHVVCWNCLTQWVSKVRPECPICRAPCSANEILPLHNYAPVL